MENFIQLVLQRPRLTISSEWQHNVIRSRILVSFATNNAHASAQRHNYFVKLSRTHRMSLLVNRSRRHHRQLWRSAQKCCAPALDGKSSGRNTKCVVHINLRLIQIYYHTHDAFYPSFSKGNILLCHIKVLFSYCCVCVIVCVLRSSV